MIMFLPKPYVSLFLLSLVGFASTQQAIMQPSVQTTSPEISQSVIRLSNCSSGNIFRDDYINALGGLMLSCSAKYGETLTYQSKVTFYDESAYVYAFSSMFPDFQFFFGPLITGKCSDSGVKNCMEILDQRCGTNGKGWILEFSATSGDPGTGCGRGNRGDVGPWDSNGKLIGQPFLLE